MSKKLITLATLGGGVLEEMFAKEVIEITKNICDPNTSATKPREINIKIKIEPTENREAVHYKAFVDSKHCPKKGFGAFLYVLDKTDECGLYESDTRQEKIDFGGMKIVGEE